MRFKTIMFVFLVASALVVPALAKDIYLAPDGDDSKGGETKAKAVATLKRAVALAQSQGEGEPTVIVLPGIYYGQFLNLPAKKGTALHLKGTTGADGSRPAFVGEGDSYQSWLTLKASKGEPTNLVVEGLEVRHYATAISLEGNRDEIDAYNAQTVIRDNVFQDIGSIATGDEKMSTAAIRLVNSHENQIVGNRFVNIRNIVGCTGLHPIYMAHFSSNNVVSNNHFEKVCGSAIKLRDRSNGNVIENNEFVGLEGVPVVQEWFCDKQTNKDCTKALGECPSTGNVMRGNRLRDSTGAARMLSISRDAEPRPWCSAADFAGARVDTAD